MFAHLAGAKIGPPLEHAFYCGFAPAEKEIRAALDGAPDIALIDAAFEARIDIVENGASRRVSVFEAIFLQLWTKEMSGDKRAIAVRLKYQEFASQQGGPSEIIVEHVCQESNENE